MKTFISKDGKHEITRISRWIAIKTNYNVGKNNSLYEFSTDENGYTPGESNYNPENGTYLDYFRFNGKTYATSQFVGLGSVCCGGQPYEFTDTDGKSTFVHAVDFYGDLYYPLYIELSECCDAVRVYTVETVGKYYHL